MNLNATYETPSIRLLTMQTEQVGNALSSVNPGSGASAGGKIMQSGSSDDQPSIWI